MHFPHLAPVSFLVLLRHLWPALAAVALVLGGCKGESTLTPPPAPTQAVQAISLLAFAEDMPEGVLHDFTRERGVRVRVRPYQSPEEAEAIIRSQEPLDVLLIENQLFPSLIHDGLLTPLNPTAIPNFKNIAASFRDLAFDPGNRYSAPASYGTTGLIVRTDLIREPISRWADLWNPAHAGRIGLRAQPREVIGLTLRSLGYRDNSENPTELAAAEQRLLALKPAVKLLPIEANQAVAQLLRGEIAILHGYAEDYQLARAADDHIAYVLPAEGTALWGESYAIARATRHPRQAEALIDFLLRPEITARIISEKKYAQPNDAALAMLAPALRHDAVIFPSNQDVARGFLLTPLSPQAQQRYHQLWHRFLHEPPGSIR